MMTEQATGKTNEGTSRRGFLKTTTGVLASGAIASNLNAAVFADGTDVLRVGLIGCGGRGTGAAAQALSADPQTKLVAMGDAFADRVTSSLENLKKNAAVKDRVAVDEDHQFAGFDAYKKVIDCADVVVLATPPHFRPIQLRAAVEAGKHCFVEKPVAVDAPGVRSILETCELAKKKGLSIVSGLCWRYHHTLRATFNQLAGGAIGEILAIQCSYNSGGVWDPRRTREQCESDMEYQMRNWYYYTWLCGDFNVEQHVHSLDKMGWAMNDVPPVKASGVGGRQQRVDPKYGNIYDHFAVVYEYENGVKGFSRCRHYRGCPSDVTDQIIGSNGTCHISSAKTRIEGDAKWFYQGPGCNMYQVEHNELFDSIRTGRPINNGEYMSRSTMLAILGRMVAYTGKTLTWDQAINSQEDLTPPKYDWIPLETPPIAVPGVTPFV